MKILYCIHSLHNSGGMERIITAKANFLSRNGFSVFIITAEQRGRPFFFPLDDSVTVIDVGINYSENSSALKKILTYYTKKKKHKKKMFESILSINPDVVISTFGNEAFFLYKMKIRSKKILEIHFAKNYRLFYRRNGIWKLLDILRNIQEQRIVAKYDKFIVLTYEDKIQWGNLPNIEVIPNFITAAPNHISNLNLQRVVAVGRLAYQKGYNRLIEAWKIVIKEKPNWKLQIYGDGDLYDDLRFQIAKAGLDGNITIFSSIKCIDDIYLNSSLLVLTSHYEGLPMVLLEAISYGLPIVAFTCKCGPKDVISDGSDGFLVAEGNIELLAQKMTEIMSDDSLRKRMGNNALMKSKEFSERVIMEKWMKLLSNISTNDT